MTGSGKSRSPVASCSTAVHPPSTGGSWRQCRRPRL